MAGDHHKFGPSGRGRVTEAYLARADDLQHAGDEDAARRLLRHSDYVIRAHARCILDKLRDRG